MQFQYQQSTSHLLKREIKINEEVKVQDQNFTVIGIIKSVPDVSGFVAFGDWALAGKQTLEILKLNGIGSCLLYTSPSPRDAHESRMPSSA